MLINYLKVAFRNLVKKRVYSFINILGLSIGAASTLLIFLYVQKELSYDKFYTDTDQLYRLVVDRQYPDRTAKFAMIPDGWSNVIAEEIPEVEKSSRLIGFTDFADVFKYEDALFRENFRFFADSNFFDVLDFELLKGDPKKVLRKPNTVILTQSMAKKYFGDADPIGKQILINEVQNEVVGLMQDIPRNSHIKFDFLSPSLEVNFFDEPSYYVSSSYTYVKLVKGANPELVEQKFPALVEKYAAGQIERDLGVSFKSYTEAGNGYNYLLQPIEDIHLKSSRTNEIKPNGNDTYVKMLIFISILILAIAGINFINLATARSAERAKEVGVRKVLGSLKKQLVYQFLSESFLLSAISVVIAIAMIQASLGWFNRLLPEPLEFTLTNWSGIILLISITLLLGLMAGLYPAFYISSLRPVQVLKGTFRSSVRGNTLRQGLMIFQFCISIILIAATLVVFRQLQYMQQKDLGFEKNNVVAISHNGQNDDPQAITNEIKTVPGVMDVGYGNANPGGYFFGIPFQKPGETEVKLIRGVTVDDHYGDALGLRLLSGRMFSESFNDSLSIILNEAAVKAIGLTDPIGARLNNSANFSPNQSTYTVVGVVADFNFESLKKSVDPLAIFNTEGQYNFHSVITVRLDGNDPASTLAAIESKWKNVVPGEPFIYSFLDSTLDGQYASEQTSGKILALFTSVAILIACVGLFGLAAYMANQRTKEIGVRKILGASIANIVGLLSKDFARLVLISLMVGIPLAFYLMSRWLESFAYRTSLSFQTFLLAGATILIITGITISYQAIKAATANPVNSLKDE